jgi:hypothetical protein
MIIVSLALNANRNDFNIVDYNLNAEFNDINRLLTVKAQIQVNHLNSRNIDLMFTHFAKIKYVYLQTGKRKNNITLDYLSQDSIRFTLPKKN